MSHHPPARRRLPRRSVQALAAASILAKHARDTAFTEICTRYHADFGPIAGGGYANAATRRFLDAYARVHGGLPPEARKSWGAEKLPSEQLTLEAIASPTVAQAVDPPQPAPQTS